MRSVQQDTLVRLRSCLLVMWLVFVVDALVEEKKNGNTKNPVALDFDRICSIVRDTNILARLNPTVVLADDKRT